MGEKGISNFCLHKSQIHNWTTCKRCGYYAIMNLPKSIETDLITEVGIGFHKTCNSFFDKVDVSKITDRQSTIDYFMSILNGSPEDKELLQRFAQFQYDRFEAFKGPRWYPCNRELEVIRPSRGLWGTIDSIEYLNPNDDDKVVVEYKTGELNEWRIPKLRRELAVYKLLVDGTKMAPKPIQHIGAFCAGNANYKEGILFEKLKSQTITALFKVIKEIRTTFEKAYIAPGCYIPDYFPKEATAFCMLCSFSNECYGDNNV